jgi:hypothetical protein
MRQHLNRTRLERRTRRLEQAVTVRAPRPTARDHYATAALTVGVRG